jgi:hypothetical protein
MTPSSQFAPGSFAARMKNAASQLALNTDPSQPGALMKVILGSAIHALPDGAPQLGGQPSAPQPDPAAPGGWRGAVGNMGRAVQGIGRGLGDAAAVGTVPSGGGALEGISRTLGARSERLANEDKQAAAMAESNARMTHEQKLTHQLDEADIQNSVTNGQREVALLNAQARPGKVIATDKTADELKQYLKDKKFDPTQETAYPTGRRQAGENPDGTPRYLTTYTAMGVPQEVLLNPDSAADKTVLDRWNKFAPPAPGKTWQGDSNGIVRVDGTQFNTVSQQASDVEAATRARNNTLVNNGLADKEQAQKLEASSISPDWVNALANAQGDPINALKAMLKDPKMVQKYPNLEQDVRQNYGEDKNGTYNWDTLVKNREKGTDDYTKRQDDQAKENEVIRHDKADEANKAADLLVKQTEANINKVPASVVPLTPEVQQKIASLPAPYQAVLKQYDPNTQSSLMAIAYGNGEQDLEKNFPSRLTKGAPGLNTQQALGVIHQINPNWSEQSYGVKTGMYKSATTGKLSQQSDSLNNFIGHAAEAQTITNKLFNNADPKLFKGTINAISKAGYGTDAVSLGEAISVVNGEFDNMVKSGYAPTQDEVAAQSTLVNANSTVGQINAAIKVMSHMAGVRASTMDGHYKTSTGDHFPNLINEDNQDNARSLGIHVENFYTGGRIGGSGNAPQQQNTQTGTQGTAAQQQNTQTGTAQAAVNIPKNTVHVQIPGQLPGYVSATQLAAFQKAHPDAKVIQ